MKERIKIIAGVLSFAMVFGIFASCGGNSNSADENSDSISDTAEIPNSSVETVESPWTEEPEIKSVFFSDFGREENIGENWSVVNYSWGQNGVTRENAGFTRSPGVVRGQGASGGIIVLNSYGDYYKDPAKRGQGA